MKKTTIKIKFVKLSNNGVHLLIKPRINHMPGILIVDTGASNTVFDKTRIERLIPDPKFKQVDKMSTGLGTSSMESHSVVIDQFQLGEILLRKLKVMVLDLSHVNASYEEMNLKAIDGVIGGDILKKYNAVIDYKKKILALEVPSVQR
jgi:predicted aspartyl protease